MLILKLNMSANFGLSNQTTELIKLAFSKFPAIEKVKIFGSRAMGNYQPGSDIDLAIFAKTFSYNDLLEVELALDDLELLYKIDLLDYNKIDHQELRNHIDEVGKVIYMHLDHK